MKFETFKEIAQKNIDRMLDEMKNRKIESSGSFSELLFKSVSIQSINIRMGVALERTWNEFLATIDGVEIDSREKINNHQVDILFKYKGVLYYLESKNNINLDTKKSAKEKEVLDEVRNILEENEEKVVAKFINNRYSFSKYITKFKYPILREDIIGYSEMFSIFDIKVSKEEWEEFFAYIGSYILEVLKGV